MRNIHKKIRRALRKQLQLKGNDVLYIEGHPKKTQLCKLLLHEIFTNAKVTITTEKPDRSHIFISTKTMDVLCMEFLSSVADNSTFSLQGKVYPFMYVSNEELLLLAKKYNILLESKNSSPFNTLLLNIEKKYPGKRNALFRTIEKIEKYA